MSSLGKLFRKINMWVLIIALLLIVGVVVGFKYFGGVFEGAVSKSGQKIRQAQAKAAKKKR